MYYLTENNDIISDEEKEKMNVSNNFKKQSENAFDLIEVGDLVKRKHKNEIDILDVNEIYLKNLQSNEYNYLKKEIIAIYKPNEKGDYIKVWEVKR